MRTLLLAFLLLPLTASADEVRLTVGMSHDEAIATIKKNSGNDITPGLAITGPKGEWPLTGIYWEFKDYDAIIALSSREGKVTDLTFWTKKDFGESKNHRAQSQQEINALKIDTQSKAVSIEKPKPVH